MTRHGADGLEGALLTLRGRISLLTVLVVFLSPSRQIPGKYLKSDQDLFLPRLF